MRTVLPSFALALLLSLPLAAAEAGTAALDAFGPVPLWGAVDVGPARGLVVHAAGGAPSALGQAAAVRITVLTVVANDTAIQESRETFDFAQASLELDAGAVLVFPAQPPEAAAGAPWSARVAGAPVDPAALGFDGAPTQAPAAMLAPADGLLPVPDPARSPERRAPGQRPSMVAMPPGEPTAQFALLPGDALTLEGHLYAGLEAGGVLRVRTAEGERAFASDAREETRTEPAATVPVVGPVGGRQVTTTTFNYTYLEVPGGALTLPGNAGQERPRTLLVAPGLRVHVAGAAGFADTVGAVRVGQAEHRARHQDVLLGGDLVLTPRSWSGGEAPPGAPPGAPPSRGAAHRAQHGVEGDITFLQVRGAEAQSFAPLVVAGGAAVGLAALLALVPAAKFGATKLLVAPLYTRLRKPEVLEQRRREQLLDAIRAQPGSNATELAQRLGMGWGNLVYHLGVLERERLVSSCREGRHRRFFPAGHVDHSLQPSLALLKNASAARVLDVIRANPGLAQKRLSAQTGLSPSTINWHVERLSEAGLVWRRQEGREVQYYPSDLLQQLDQAEGHVAG